MKENILLTMLVVVGIGCQLPGARNAVLEKLDIPAYFERPEEQSGSVAQTNLPIVGFTKTGDVVIFDGMTGEISSSAEGGGGRPSDVAMDPWRNVVWVFEENEDGSGGEIRFCPLRNTFDGMNAADQPPDLQPCEHSAWIDGLARLLPMKEGLWVFEDGIGGARYKVIARPEITPSVSGPRPASIWTRNGEIEVFSYGFQNDRLQLSNASFTSTGPSILQTFDWGEPLGFPPTARYAWLSHDAGLLFDAASNFLTVRRMVQGEMGVPLTIDVGMPVSRIEAAVNVGASTFVLGKDALWILTRGDAQSSMTEGNVEFVAGLWLHGDVRQSSLFFSRDLLVTPNRVFVGTDRGVRAVGLEYDKDAANSLINVFYDEQFVGEVLRGPLDEVRPNGS